MIKIDFKEDYNLYVINAALTETYMGYAGNVLPGLLGTTKDKLETLHKEVERQRNQSSQSMTLPLDDWKILYHAVNIVLYELGPEELDTLTGYFALEFLNTARMIYLKALDITSTRAGGTNILLWTKDDISK